jgi:hypothetical protein
METYKIVHQVIISKNKNEKIGNNNDNIIKTFKGFRHIVWTYNEILSFMFKNKDFEILDSIRNIKAYAFKSDIARYYIINKMGGFYIDLNTFLNEVPDVSNIDMIFFKDNGTKNEKAIMNGFFYSKPDSKVLNGALNICIENIKNKYYGDNPPDITGVNVLGNSFYSNYSEYKFLLENFYHKDDNYDNGYYIDKKNIGKYKPNGLKNGNSGLSGGNNYEDLWFKKQLYDKL